MLTEYAKQSTMKLTTTGRKTGKKHAVPIWFVVASPQSVYIQHVTAPAHWCKNLTKTPAVEMEFDGRSLSGRATVIADAARKKEILALFRRKYFMARFLQFFGRKNDPFVAQVDLVDA